MAKGKHAAALFEVIHSGRNAAPKSVLSTPKWWWKRGRGNAVTSTSMFASPNAPSDSDPTIEHDPTLSHTMVHTAVNAGVHAGAHTSSESSDGAPANAVAVDAERRLITFKFSYNSAIISGFAVVVIVLMAYLVGRKMNAGPVPTVAAETSAQLRAKPARPDVLMVAPGTRTGAQAPQHAEPETGTSSRTSDAADVERGNGAAAPAGQEQPASVSQDRILGLNYVVVQSYPDEKNAIEARDVLIKSGVVATIEQKLRGLNQSWFIVVGTKGFPRASGAEYDAYIEKIQGVSANYARSKRSFRAFQPIPYKWDKAGSQKAVG